MCNLKAATTNMKAFLLLIFATITFNGFGQASSSLIGTIYRESKELKQLENYSVWVATLIDKKDTDSNEYAIVWFNDSLTDRQLIILEKIVRDSPSQKQPNYLILDTLFVQFKSKDDWISICECYQDSAFNPELIALVKAVDNPEYFTKIKKAWVADISLGKIVSLKKSRGIKCVNQDFGVGCDDSEE
jgi:hypothetical protein